VQKDGGNVRYYLLFKNKRVWNILHNKFEMLQNQAYWKTPSFVRHASPQMLKHYIQGFCDAEGGVPNTRRVIAGSEIYLNFTQKNEETLEFIKMALMNFGIKTGKIVVSDKKSKSLRIWITEKRSILRFI
jgi:intein-encoded DNA endonuclease-like protein